MPHPAAHFHHVFMDAVREHIAPAQIVATVLLVKLRERGIDAADHVEYLKSLASKVLAAPLSSGDAAFELQIDGSIVGGADLSIEVDAADVEAAISKVSEAVEAASDDFLKSLSAGALRGVLEKPAVRLLHLANERDAFLRRLEHTWSTAFQLLDIHVALCAELGEDRNEWLRSRRRRSKDIVVVDVVTRLHGRAVQVAREVQALLRNGFADGALSRWRTMHELTVVTMFILDRGVAVAERYLAHVDADSIKAARQYEMFASALNHRPISARDKRRLERLESELESKYGKPFLSEYGWAAESLKVKKPTFTDIEAAVNLDHLRPYSRLASGAVHAGSKSMFFRLGTLGEQDLILTGASNAGLDEGGRLAALSLAQITSALLMLHANTDSAVWSRVLMSLSSKVEQQFVKIQRRIKREEQRTRAGDKG
jgi:hypothetical protein